MHPCYDVTIITKLKNDEHVGSCLSMVFNFNVITPLNFNTVKNITVLEHILSNVGTDSDTVTFS